MFFFLILPAVLRENSNIWLFMPLLAEKAKYNSLFCALMHQGYAQSICFGYCKRFPRWFAYFAQMHRPNSMTFIRWLRGREKERVPLYNSNLCMYLWIKYWRQIICTNFSLYIPTYTKTQHMYKLVTSFEKSSFLAGITQ